MAQTKSQQRNEEPEQVPESGRWLGVLLLALGVFGMLALISYHPADLPSLGAWFDLFRDTAHQGRGNFMGSLGALVAFFTIWLCGAAAWLMPAGLIWLGLVKLVYKQSIFPGKILGLLGLWISAAIWMDIARYFFVDWAKFCHIVSPSGHGLPGGYFGYLLGTKCFEQGLGRVGSLLFFAFTYLAALTLLVDQNPWVFGQSCVRFARRQWQAYQVKRAAEIADFQRREREEYERSRQRELRMKEREAAAFLVKKPSDGEAIEEPRKTASTRKPATNAVQPVLPLQDPPKPQIIDASQQKPIASMAGEKPFERKKPEHQSLRPTGFDRYELPGFDLLDEPAPVDVTDSENDHDELLQTQKTIISTLRAFNVDVTPGDITRGPTITRYEIYPSQGLRVARITQLESDLARATKAEQMNILAPIVGKDTVGIEIANSKKTPVPLRELLSDPEFRSAKKKIPLALGKDVYGKTVIGDLAAMPHLLVAGSTGSGKSVCINSIIASMLFKFGPDELRFIMVDPKVVEMQIYNKLPHLVVPVVTDPKKVVAALRWVVNEMEKRYRMFAKVGVRNFDGFNTRVIPEVEEPLTPDVEEEEEEVDMDHIESIALALESGELGPEEDPDLLTPDEAEMPARIPYIVVIIDELADLMQTSSADVESNIARIAAKARAAGIHLIVATQTPRADVVTGIIKTNLPCRIAFQVSSQLDSRVILDTKGAEKLVGKGDMLYLPPGSSKLERAQGAFVSDREVERLVEHCSSLASPRFEEDILKSIDEGFEEGANDTSDADEEMVIRCIEVVRQEQKASTSLLQRRLKLGYGRAARMMDLLEQRRVISPADGAKAREVYVK